MKKMRKIIPAFAMLMVSAILMSTASYAWFSLGTTATANNMQIQAQAGSSLVISTSADGLASANAKVTFAAANNTLTPATRDLTIKDGVTGDSPALIQGNLQYSSGLKAITNAEDAVDAGSGVAASTATFANATSGINYVDYVVYIASAGGVLTNATLKATVIPTAVEKYLHNAITIDFWVKAGINATSTYINSINVVEAKAAEAKVIELNVGDIPAVTEQTVEDYFVITMRIYFDGALMDGDNCYVRNATVTDTAATLGVKFEAVVPSSGS